VFDDATHSISATKIRKEMGIEWTKLRGVRNDYWKRSN
jgi:hypothetical protein